MQPETFAKSRSRFKIERTTVTSFILGHKILVINRLVMHIQKTSDIDAYVLKAITLNSWYLYHSIKSKK
jgi:hypothetical protein